MLVFDTQVVHFPATPAVCYPQIHRLKRTEDLVGACCKAGYDGEYQSKAITNEVYPLCRRELFLSTTPRRSCRQG